MRLKELTAEKDEFQRRHEDCTAAADLERLFADRDKIHVGKLAKAKEEVLQLKGELEKLKKEHAKEIAQVTSDSEKTVAEQKQLTEKAVTQVSAVQKDLDTFVDQQNVWLSVLTHTQAAMRERFPESEDTTRKVVESRWMKRAEEMHLESSWSIEDHLLALQATVEPMKIMGLDIFQASIEMVRALWPDDKLPLFLAELAARLVDGPERLDDWRASAGQVGADESFMSKPP